MPNGLPITVTRRCLGRTGFVVSPVGFGSFKIGRNQKTKYPNEYALPDLQATERLLGSLLDLGINYIDTAPAYGLSEERIGQTISHRRGEFVLSSKVGETFEDNRSTYDFSRDGIQKSISRSLDRLRTDCLDLVFIHSNNEDLSILNETDAVETLCRLKDQGVVKAVGLSGKTIEGARQSLEWADVLMVEYHLNDRSHEAIIAEAAQLGVGVIVKKGLGSGHLPADESIRFVLGNPHVSSLVIGGLNLEHFRSNLSIAAQAADV